MIGGRVRIALLAGAALVSLTGCELKDDGDNLVNGKTLFVQKCAQCHTLARADAKGVVGPSLDEAWQQAARDVAAYVASAAANPGKDTGRLAAAGAPEQEELAKAEGGKLEMPTDPT